jgi:hypothetical protein
MQRMSNRYETVVNKLFLSIWGLIVIQAIGFAAWGYTSMAVLLPWVIGYYCILCVATSVGLIAVKHDERPFMLVRLGLALLLLSTGVGTYRHPSDELAAVMVK